MCDDAWMTTAVFNGNRLHGGDGLPPLNASAMFPYGIARDGARGRLFVADTSASCIRMVADDAVVSTVAGSPGAPGFADGTGEAALFKQPTSLVFDVAGDRLLIADQASMTVRALLRNGSVVTLLGNGSSSGGTPIAPATPASRVRLGSVTGLSLGEDTTGKTLYVSVRSDNVVLKVSNGLVFPYAGNFSAGFSGDAGAAQLAQLSSPADVTFCNDPFGTPLILIADAGNRRVRAVDVFTGLISTFAGVGISGTIGQGDGGPATSAYLAQPAMVRAFRSSVFIVDITTCNLHEVTLADRMIRIVAGGSACGLADPADGPARGRRFAPQSLDFNSITGGVTVADASLYPRVRTLNCTGDPLPSCPVGGDGTVTRFFGDGSARYAGDGARAATASLKQPLAVAYDTQRAVVYVADGESGVIRAVALSAGSVASTIAGDPAAPYAASLTPAYAAFLGRPSALHVSSDGVLYIGDSASNRVRRMWRNGTVDTFMGANASSCVSGALVSDCSLGQLPPTGITSDGATGDVYVSSAFGIGRVSGSPPRVFLLAQATNASQCPSPAVPTAVGGVSSIHWAPSTRSLYYSDRICGQVWMLLPNATLVAGNGSIGLAPDGSPALLVALPSPSDVQLYWPSGSLFISDEVLGVVIEVTADGRAWTVIGRPGVGAARYSSLPAAVTSGLLLAPARLLLLGPSRGVADPASATAAVGASLSFLVVETNLSRVVRADCVRTAAAALQSLALPLSTRINPRVCPAGGSVISTAAGSTHGGTFASGALATDTRLSGPTSVVFDPLTNSTFVANSGVYTVVRINATGYAFVVAGVQSSPLFNGDGLVGTSTNLNTPTGLAINVVDRVLWIAEANGGRIRALDLTSNTISTAVGLGFSYAPPCLDGTPATQCNVSNPYSVAWNPCAGGQLFFSDPYRSVIRVRRADGRIYTLAGSPVPGAGTVRAENVLGTSLRLNGPRGLAVDTLANKLIFADTANSVVRELDLATGMARTIAGSYVYGAGLPPVADGSLAAIVPLIIPWGVAVGPGGTVFISDTNGHAVYALDRTSGLLDYVAGNGTAGGAVGDGGPAACALMSSPMGVAYVPSQQRLLVAQNSANTLRSIACLPSASTAAALLIAGDGYVGGSSSSPDSFQPATCALEPLVCPAGRSIISTFAGNATGITFSDGLSATSAALMEPSGIAFDPLTNITFFSDDSGAAGHVIRQVFPNGTIGTLAGIPGSFSLTPDGPPRSTTFFSPKGLALDLERRVLFVADYNNNRIRAIPLPGAAADNVSTVAGTGVLGGSRTDGTPALQISVNLPWDVAWDGCRGELYWTSYSDACVYVLRRSGLVYRVLGGGAVAPTDRLSVLGTSASFGNARGLHFAPDISTLFVTDSGFPRVWSLNVDTGYAQLVAGTGGVGSGIFHDGAVAAATVLNVVSGVRYVNGTLFVAQPNAHSVVAITLSDGLMYTLAGNASANGALGGDGGPAAVASLSGPLCLEYEPFGRRLFVGDGGVNGRRVRSISCLPTVATAATMPPSFVVNSTVLPSVVQPLCPQLPGRYPLECAAGTSWASNYAGIGVPTDSPEGLPATSTGLSTPVGMAFDDATNNTFICVFGRHTIMAVNESGHIRTVAGIRSVSVFNGDGGLALNTTMNNPTGVAVDVVGRTLMIAEWGGNRIRLLDLRSNRMATVVGTGQAAQAPCVDGSLGTNCSVSRPIAVTFDPCGQQLFFSESGFSLVRVLRLDGRVFTIAGSLQAGTRGLSHVLATATLLDNPQGLTLDVETGTLFFAESLGGRVRAVNLTSGNISTVAGSGVSGTQPVVDGLPAIAVSLGSPTAVLVARGMLWITDANFPSVYAVSLRTGLLYTVLGNGSPGTSGYTGPAAQAKVQSPAALAYLPLLGRILVSDSGAGYVRAIDCVSAPEVSAMVRLPRYAPTRAPPGSAASFQPASCPLVVSTPVICPAGSSTIHAFAGNVASRDTSDNIAATDAQFVDPGGIAFDPVANVTYIADRGLHTIRQIFSNGTIGTLAGIPGTFSDSGDNKALRSTTLYSPKGLALNVADRVLYVAELHGYRIRSLFLSTNVARTAVGTGLAGLPPADGTFATAVSVNEPWAVAFDPCRQELYFSSDTDAAVYVRRRSGAVYRVLGGGGTVVASSRSVFGTSIGLVFGGAGLHFAPDVSMLFVASGDGCQVLALQADSGYVHAVVGSGDCGSEPIADASDALSIAMSAADGILYVNGTLFVAQPLSRSIIAVTLADSLAYTFSGNASADDGNSGDGKPTIDALWSCPRELAYDPFSRQVLVGDAGNSAKRVRAVSCLTKPGVSAAILHMFNATGLPLTMTPVCPVLPDPFPLTCPSGTSAVSAFAGTGMSGDAVDGLPATNTSLSVPTGLAFDPVSNVTFIANSGQMTIRAVNGSGYSYTVAGIRGVSAPNGDGKVGSATTLQGPYGLGIDVVGRMLYITQPSVNTVRSMSLTTSIVVTVAGTGRVGTVPCANGTLARACDLLQPDHVVWDACGQQLLVSEAGFGMVRALRGDGRYYQIAGATNGSAGGSGVPATSVMLQLPRGLAVDQSTRTLYIAESGGRQIRAVDLRTGIITTVAGSGSLGAAPVPEGFPALLVGMGSPTGVIVARSTLLYTDSLLSGVYAVSLTTGLLYTVLGNGVPGSSGDGGPAGGAQMHTPAAIALQPVTGRILVADASNRSTVHVIGCNPVPEVAADFRLEQYAPSEALPGSPRSFQPAACPAPPPPVMTPPICPSGTSIITAFAGGLGAAHSDGIAAPTAALSSPSGMVFDPVSNATFVSDAVGDTGCVIRVVWPNGTIDTVAGVPAQCLYNGDGRPGRNTTLFAPRGLTLDAVNRTLFIAETGGNRIRALSLTSGIINVVVGSGIPAPPSPDGTAALAFHVSAPWDVAWDGCRSELYWSSPGGGSIYVQRADGRVYKVMGGGDSNNATGTRVLGTTVLLPFPRGLHFAADISTLFVSNSARVWALHVDTGFAWAVTGVGDFSATGMVVDGSLANDTALVAPYAVSYLNGTLFVTQYSAHSMVAVTLSDGRMWNVAGNASRSGDDGDGGPAASAHLSNPFTMAADPVSLRLFVTVSASLTQRVRAIHCAPQPDSAATIVPAFSFGRPVCPQLGRLHPLECPSGSSPVSTFAGLGTNGNSVDGLPATATALSLPYGLVVDPVTNTTYVANSGLHTIRAINASGLSFTVAGVRGVATFNGDGRLAVNTTLRGPAGLAIDIVGRVLYISELNGYRVRAMSLLNNTVSTVAGTGIADNTCHNGTLAVQCTFLQLYSIGWDPCRRQLLLADAGTGFVHAVRQDGRAFVLAGSNTAPSGLVGVPGTATQLKAPRGLFVHVATDVLFFCETDAALVRALHLRTGLIRTVAGTGTFGSTGVVDGSSALAASLISPWAVHVVSNTLFVADFNLHAVLGVELSTSRMFTLLGNASVTLPGGDGGPAAFATLTLPAGLTYHASLGRLLISDQAGRVRAVACAPVPDIAASFVADAYAGSGAPSGSPASFQPAVCPLLPAGDTPPAVPPAGLEAALDPPDALCASTASTIEAYAGSGVDSATSAGSPALQAAVAGPVGIAHDAGRNLTFISSPTRHLVLVILPDGAIQIVAGQADSFGDVDSLVGGSPGLLNGPQGLDWDPDERVLYIADAGNAKVRALTPDFRLVTVAGGGTASLTDGALAKTALMPAVADLAWDRCRKRLFLLTVGNQTQGLATQVLELRGDGALYFVTRGAGAPLSAEGRPLVGSLLRHAVAISYAPGIETLFVVEAATSRIISARGDNGNVVVVAGNTTLASTPDGSPTGLAALIAGASAVRYWNGSVFFLQVGSSSLREITASGRVYTVAGFNGSLSAGNASVEGDSGDGGPAYSALLRGPQGFVVDPANGRVILADTGNNRVRQVRCAGPRSAAFPNGLAGVSSRAFPAWNASALGDRWADKYGSALPEQCPPPPRGLCTDPDTLMYTLAVGSPLRSPAAFAENPRTGSIWVSDWRQHTIYRIDGGLDVTRIAGVPDSQGRSPDGARAAVSTLNSPLGLAFSPASNTLWYAEFASNQVRGVLLDSGTLTTVAGSSSGHEFGPEGLALNASLKWPRGLALDPTGQVLYVTCSNGIAAITLGDGQLRIVGGALAAGVSEVWWDPRTSLFSSPDGIAVDAMGSALVVAEAGGSVVRQLHLADVVTADVTLELAGSGRVGYWGDGGPAIQASLNNSHGVALARDETVFIADTASSVVREVTPSGAIWTVAGTGVSGNSTGAAIAASSAALYEPLAVLFQANASILWIADSRNGAIRYLRCGARPVPSASGSPLPAPSPSPTPSRTSAPSATPSASPPLVTPVRLTAQFEGAMQTALSPGSSSIAGVVPVAAVSRAWQPPTLRLLLAQGCIAAAAASVSCEVDTNRGRLPVFGAGIASDDGLAATSAAMVSPVAAYPSVVHLRQSGGGCLSWPSEGIAFQLHDNRSWATSGGLDTCPSANLGYLFPVTETLPVICRLIDTSAPRSSYLLAEATAVVLLVQAALPVPLDILIYRAPRQALESMRTQVQVPVLMDQQLQLQLQARNNTSAPATMQSMLLSTAAERSEKTGAATSVATSAIAGSTLLVIKLASSVAPPFPSPLQLRLQAQQMLLDAAPFNGSGIPFMDAMSSAAACVGSVASSLASVHFPLRLAVYVGSVRANITWAAPDGGHLHVVTPSYEQVCGSSRLAPAATQRTGACGYQPIRLVYEPEPGPHRRLQGTPGLDSSTAWLPVWLAESAGWNESETATFLLSPAVQSSVPVRNVISCPPWCPNTVPAGALPLAMAVDTASGSDAWAGMVVPAHVTTDAATGVALGLNPLVAPSAVQYAPGGLYYSAKCSAAGFTDWETGACTNVSDPTFSGCAFGAGGECSPCPRVGGKPAAMCPGGFRAIPLPGFYTPSESSGAVSKCAAPAEQRCTGWNATVGAVSCGAGYRPFSPGCLACAPGFYYDTGDTSGSCRVCPSAGPMGPMLRALLVFVAVVAGAFSFVFGVAFVAAKVRGGTIIGGTARMLDLLIWIVAVLQLLSQVGRTASAGLPDFISTLFAVLASFQFESVAIPAACWSGYPFTPQMALMATTLALSGLLWLVIANRSRCVSSLVDEPSGKRLARNRKSFCSPPRRLALHNLVCSLLFSLASLLYAPTANTTLSLLACSWTHVSLLALSSLDGGGGSSADLSADTGTASVLLLNNNPSFVCYAGSHLAAAALAWTTLLVVVAGYPLWTFWWAGQRTRWLVRRALDAELQVGATPGEAPFGQVTKLSEGSMWTLLQDADRTALRAVLLRWPVAAWMTYIMCGQERLIRRWHVPSAESTRSPPAAGRSAGDFELSEAEVAALAVRAISKRAVLAGAGPSHAAAPSPGTSFRNRGSPALSGSNARGSAAGPPGSVATAEPSDGIHPHGARRRKPSPVDGSLPPVGLLQSEACNTCADVVQDGPLRPFVGSTFRASAFYAQQSDMVAMSTLAATQWFWQRPTAAGQVAGRAALYVLTLVLSAWLIGTRNPFWPHDAWKLYVKVGSLLLAALAAVLTHFDISLSLSYGLPPDASEPGYASDQTIRVGLSYAVFAGCVLLALVLMLGFWADSVSGAQREEQQQRDAALARLSFLAAAAGATESAIRPHAQFRIHAVLAAGSGGHDEGLRTVGYELAAPHRRSIAGEREKSIRNPLAEFPASSGNLRALFDGGHAAATAHMQRLGTRSPHLVAGAAPIAEGDGASASNGVRGSTSRPAASMRSRSRLLAHGDAAGGAAGMLEHESAAATLLRRSSRMSLLSGSTGGQRELAQYAPSLVSPAQLRLAGSAAVAANASARRVTAAHVRGRSRLLQSSSSIRAPATIPLSGRHAHHSSSSDGSGLEIARRSSVAPISFNGDIVRY